MNADNLVYMANRIGEFFLAMPDRQEALEQIAQHIKRNWAPIMRAELLQLIDRGGAAALHPPVRDAVLAHRALLESGTRAASKPL
ncbi:MAG: formate dehydrogenase subunit delta [Desulfovibrionaceae bacterium]|nr:formate dehydrogenase subunit delta [Desulfovibrionaceae bacterium]